MLKVKNLCETKSHKNLPKFAADHTSRTAVKHHKQKHQIKNIHSSASYQILSHRESVLKQNFTHIQKCSTPIINNSNQAKCINKKIGGCVSDRNNVRSGSKNKMSLHWGIKNSDQKANKNRSLWLSQTNSQKCNFENIFERINKVLCNYQLKEEQWKKEKAYLLKELQKYEKLKKNNEQNRSQTNSIRKLVDKKY